MHSKKYSFWIVVAVLLVAVASNAGPAAGADEAAIRAQNTAWMKAYNAADAKSVAALYAEDAILAPPEAPAAAGRAAILAFFTKDVAGAKSGSLTLSVTGAEEVGTRASHSQAELRARRSPSSSLLAAGSGSSNTNLRPADRGSDLT
jgi:ketosteroid isomerase-like protein